MLYNIHELQSLLLPSKIENIIQEDAYNIFFCFKTIHNSSQWLQLSWNPKSAWFAVMPQLPSSYFTKTKLTRLSFESTLFSLLSGQTLIKISIQTDNDDTMQVSPPSSSSWSTSTVAKESTMHANYDRVVIYEFAEKISSPIKYKLYHEMVGMHSNVILVHADTDVIASCGYQVGGKSLRQIQTGEKFQPLLQPRGSSIQVFDEAKALSELWRGKNNTPMTADETSQQTVAAAPGMERESAAAASVVERFRIFLISLAAASSASRQPLSSPSPSTIGGSDSLKDTGRATLPASASAIDSSIPSSANIFKALLHLSPGMSPNIVCSILHCASVHETSTAEQLTHEQLKSILTFYLRWKEELQKMKKCVTSYQFSLRAETDRTRDYSTSSDSGSDYGSSSDSSDSSDTSGSSVDVWIAPHTLSVDSNAINFRSMEKKKMKKSVSHTSISTTTTTTAASATAADSMVISTASTAPAASVTSLKQLYSIIKFSRSFRITETSPSLATDQASAAVATVTDTSSSTVQIPVKACTYSPQHHTLLSYFSSYYSSQYRHLQYKQLKADNFKKINLLLDKGTSALNLYEELLFKAENGKSEDLRYQADLITSFMHTAEKVTNHASAADAQATDDIMSYSSSASAGTAAIETAAAATAMTTQTASTNSSSSSSSARANKGIQSKSDTYKPVYVVHCIDFVTQEPTTIYIDHNGLNPSEYVQYLYKQAKKTKRSLEKLKTLIAQTVLYVDYCREIENSIESMAVYTR